MLYEQQVSRTIFITGELFGIETVYLSLFYNNNFFPHILTYADFDKDFNGYSDSFVHAVKAAQALTLAIQHEVELVVLMTIVRHHKLAIDILIRVKMQSIT